MQTVRPQQSPRVRPPGLLLVTVSVHVKSLSHVQLFVTPWTLARQAPLSMGFFRQECWSGLPLPLLGDLPDPGIKPMSPVSGALQADSLLLSHRGSPLCKQNHPVGGFLCLLL